MHTNYSAKVIENVRKLITFAIENLEKYKVLFSGKNEVILLQLQKYINLRIIYIFKENLIYDVVKPLISDKMNKNDIKVIKALRKNARLKVSMLSDRTSLSVPTVYYKLQKYREEKIIKRFTILPDWKKLGYQFNMLLYVELNDKDDLLSLTNEKNVNAIFRLDDLNAYIIECLFTCGVQADKFITELEYKFKVDKIMFWLVKEAERELFMANS
ncbi:hypothetical protein COV16_00120 [Candidatus Woesearchaeota archaeon CG10_big_fil_rev_8_21_14_0_10_34_8]|nr:MAG: hypothetical protein COV16_00120 [Candidatus Woesearchaeota archaeon CG10_big_fil_rev_8_21_14_0_10_34_8]